MMGHFQRLPGAFTVVVVAAFFMVRDVPCSGDLTEQIQDRSNWLPVEPNMQWCGARCLWLAARFYGADCDFEDLLATCRSHHVGSSTLTNLSRTAEKLGFKTRMVECSAEALMLWRVAAITVHRQTRGEESVLHAQLMLGVCEGKFMVIDPFRPAVVRRFTADAFESGWTGHALLVARSDEELRPPNETYVSVFRVLLVLQGVTLILIAGDRMLVPRTRALHSLFLVACACLGAGGCGRQDAVSTTALQFETLKYVRASSIESDRLKHTFRFENAATRAVRIMSAERSCSCAVPKYPSGIIHPGEKGDVVLNVNLSGRRGKFVASADLIVATATAPDEIERHRLTVETYVVPQSSVTPSILVLPTGEVGQATRGIVRVRQYFSQTSVPKTPTVYAQSCDPSIVATIADRRDTIVDGRRVVIVEVAVAWTPTQAGTRIRSLLRVVMSDDEAQSARVTEVGVEGFALHPSVDVTPRQAILVGTKPADLTITSRDGGEVPCLSLQAIDVPDPSLTLTLKRTGSLEPGISRYLLERASGSSLRQPLSGQLVLQATNACEPKYYLPVVVLP